MDGEIGIKRRGWGLPASAAVHVLVAALVIFGLPTLPEHEPEEEAIAVTLEPPPEPAEAAPAEEPPAAPEPAEAAPPPEPPAPPAQAEAPPPPAGSQPPPAGEQAAAASLPALDPVMRFGETDAGPRESLSGAGAEDPPDPPAPLAPPDDQAAEDAPDVADQDQPEAIAEAEAAEAETAEGGEQATGEEDGAATDALVASIVAAPDKAELPAASPTTTDPTATSQTATVPEPELREARTLFSRSATGGATATTAMANIPRGIRAGRLCASELRLQLLVSAYAPDILPSYRLDEGTVLRVMRGAFRAGGEWRNLSFECQVDPQATVVRSFAFNVGDPLSRDEAARRGLPVQ